MEVALDELSFIDRVRSNTTPEHELSLDFFLELFTQGSDVLVELRAELSFGHHVGLGLESQLLDLVDNLLSGHVVVPLAWLKKP